MADPNEPDRPTFKPQPDGEPSFWTRRGFDVLYYAFEGAVTLGVMLVVVVGLVLFKSCT